MADAPELGKAAKRVISDPKNTILVSAACLWEIAIKTRRGRLTGTEEYLSRHREFHEEWGFSTLVIEVADAVEAGRLAISHTDPFDRMLIVQARRTDAVLATCDAAIRHVASATIW